MFYESNGVLDVESDFTDFRNVIFQLNTGQMIFKNILINFL